MASDFHFVSGLPRAGSTLLSAILKQNPRFHAAMTSPVASLVGAVLPKVNGASEFAAFFDNPLRERILRGLFASYYGDTTAEQVIFDTNRSWTGRTALLKTLYPRSRVICCVRDIAPIIGSVERMLRQNPLQTSRIFNFKTGTSVYARVETMMNSETGLIGTAWSTLREAWFSEDANRLLIISYDRFVKEPAAVLRGLYAALEEPWFAHDFENVEYDHPEYDAHLGMPGLHTVGRTVKASPSVTSIPPDIAAKYADANFWSKPAMNKQGALIL